MQGQSIIQTEAKTQLCYGKDFSMCNALGYTIGFDENKLLF